MKVEIMRSRSCDVTSVLVVLKVVGEWHFSLIHCDILLTLDVMMCTASILNLCAISIDRSVFSSLSAPPPLLLLPQSHPSVFSQPIRLRKLVRERSLLASLWFGSRRNSKILKMNRCCYFMLHSNLPINFNWCRLDQTQKGWTNIWHHKRCLG